MSTLPFEMPVAEGAAASALYIFAPNYSPNNSLLVLGESGTISITMYPGNPAPSGAFVAHQGGGQDQLPPNQTIQSQVNQGDVIVVTGNAASCKVEFNYL